MQKMIFIKENGVVLFERHNKRYFFSILIQKYVLKSYFCFSKLEK